MRLDFPIFNDDWTSSEELILLNALCVYGPDDWENISRYTGFKRTAKECKEHYLKCYFPDSTFSKIPSYIPYRSSSNEPPRFESSSVLYNAFSGYSAARGEFKVDYDNDAEDIASELDLSLVHQPFEEWDEEAIHLSQMLFYSVVNAYRERMRERRRRHKVMRRHGLIQPQKNFLWLRRFDDTSMQWSNRGGDRLVATVSGISPQLVRILTKFSQYLSPFQLDKLLESLKNEADLKADLSYLYEVRRNGIRDLHLALYHKKWAQRREDFLRERRKFLSNPYLNWRNLIEGKLNKNAFPIGQSRRPAPPLDISKLPGNDKLSIKERDLCSVARIVPDSFIEFRNILIAECLRRGGLRLANARNLIKIDVNKTRKLYDFLLDEGSIYLTPN
ncbi:hypothetical protein J437_LFUL009244 [Ladona fulva]|uniref:Transcriptional adapter 2-alpha n=1 Tax=Ladona fulva TaxID=123851 RepID=A0A8K0P4B2_LADFU|nr:hypothetical protein J437_LFUL009244 [Ladona fulva]